MKRALVVGIDDYQGIPLNGCVADARAIAEMLNRHEDGNKNYDVQLLTSSGKPIHRTTLRAKLAELFANARDTDLLFYFAGHGAETPWGAELVTQDYRENSLGVSMNDIITLANDSPAREVVIILDCCFSGAIGNLPDLQSGAVNPTFQLSKSLLREGVTILAAARKSEGAAESHGHGAFTRVLLEGLEGAAADHIGHVTALSLYAFASRAFGSWGQRPIFKSHVLEPTVLRTCQPPIERDLLRALTKHFATADTRVRMSPAHEGTRPIPAGVQPTLEQGEFDYFKQLRNAGLLATKDNNDLYFVALGSEEVYLTVTGRYFWRLAEGGGL